MVNVMIVVALVAGACWIVWERWGRWRTPTESLAEGYESRLIELP
jgi:hypothetical protein